jgi:Ribonucleases P/MRP protein subunit POP1
VTLFTRFAKHTKQMRKPESACDANRTMPRTAALPAFCDTIGTISALQFGARRLPELKALHHVATNDVDSTGNPPAMLIAALQSGGRKTSSRHLRRRATSHRRYQRRYHSRQHPPNDRDASPKDPGARHRRWRRQHAGRLMSTHESWRRDNSPAGETKGDTEKNINWMTTHIWHRKRFHMQSLWNWNIPLLHTNRGCASALRLVTTAQKCLVQDVTWSVQPIYFRIEELHDMTWLKAMIPEFAMDRTSDDMVCQEGMLYEPNGFPQKAIGPVTWLYSAGKNPFFSTVIPTSTSPEYSYLYLFMHPSIQPTVLSLLECMRQPQLDQGPFLTTRDGIACLQLRGANAACLDCLISSIIIAKDDASDVSSSTFDQCMQCIVASSHNTIISAALGPDTPIILRRISPRNTERSCNWGVSGIDVYCSPDECRGLFQSFVVKGGACPVGIVEATFLSLECDPPVLVFPRDYPDTVEGARYWNGICTEWQCVRHYWEGGGGRISANPFPDHLDVKWSCLVKPVLNHVPLDQDPSDPIVVVVRGKEFGEPFRWAMSGCTHPIHSVQPMDDRVNLRRRSHRSFHGMTHRISVVEAPKLAAFLRAAHEQLCGNLIDSLSLPALLVCTIQILGKGTLYAGCDIYSDPYSRRVLGYVTTGGFSKARGHCHGIAIVGAVLFLQMLVDSCVAPLTSVLLASCPMDRRKTLQCKVFVQNSHCEKIFYEASLALHDCCGES